MPSREEYYWMNMYFKSNGSKILWSSPFLRKWITLLTRFAFTNSYKTQVLVLPSLNQVYFYRMKDSSLTAKNICVDFTSSSSKSLIEGEESTNLCTSSNQEKASWTLPRYCWKSFYSVPYNRFFLFSSVGIMQRWTKKVWYPATKTLWAYGDNLDAKRIL